jgi:hypothetical protein
MSIAEEKEFLLYERDSSSRPLPPHPAIAAGQKGGC